MTADKGFKDWVPMRVYERDSSAFVDWCYMGEQRFTHPFFGDTIQLRMREPFNQVFRHQTPVESLRELSLNEAVPPTGFIFHMSRCGSTLVSQMFASVPANIVISEAPPINAIIVREVKGRPDSKGEWLRSMVTTLGRRRTGDERRYFIKFDSWNTLDLDLIRRAFPEVPWIFLYRDPVEVLVSQIKVRGSQMILGSIDGLLPGITLNDATRMPAEEYCARVLARICRSALAHADDKLSLLINYAELPGAVTGRIAEHFGISLAESEVEAMRQAAKYNAKEPRTRFEDDTCRKQSEATDAIRAAARKWLTPIYESLEQLRVTSSKER